MNGYYLLMGICPYPEELGTELSIPIPDRAALLRISRIQETIPIQDWALEPIADTYCYCLVLDRPDMELAATITRALLVTYRAIVGDLPYDLESYAIPSYVVNDQCEIELTKLIDFHRGNECEQELDDVQLAVMLGSGRVIESDLARRMCVDAGCIIEEGLIDACEYLAKSKDEFELLPGDYHDLSVGV